MSNKIFNNKRSEYSTAGKSNHSRRMQAAASAWSTMSENISPDMALVEIDGVWTLFYQGRPYVALVDAQSREDAEEQLAEMLLNAAKNRPISHSEERKESDSP